MPPRIVPNANGINNLDDDNLERRATPDTTGNNIDAAAMLFMKSDNNAAAVMMPKVNRRGPAPNKRTMKAPKRSVAPERRNPSARMKADIMIMTAERLNPEKASCEVNMPLNPNASISNNATISARRIFPSNSNTATPMKRNVILICVIS